MSRGKPRKLIRLDKLSTLAHRAQMGVPLARAIRDMRLDISRPLAAKQVQLFNMDCATKEASSLLKHSLDAPWLDYDGPTVQEQPDNWYYEGYFPFGKWVEKSE